MATTDPRQQAVATGPGGRGASRLTALYAGVAAVIVLIVVTAAVALFHLRQLAEQRAIEQTRDLASSMEQTVEGLIVAIDIALQSSADEIVRQMDDNTLDPASVTRYLIRQQRRLPQVDHFWVLDKSGHLVFGDGMPPEPQDLSDREYYRRLRDDPAAELIMTAPVVGRVHRKWFLPLARRITRADGSFGGVVFAALYVDQLDEVLAQLDMAVGGVISLRDPDLGLIVRRQAFRPDRTPIGDRTLAEPFRQALAVNPRSGSYVSGRTSIDGVSRTQSYRRSAKYGFVVNVGISREMVLADWRRQVVVVAGFAAAGIAALLGCSWQVTRLWRRQDQNLEALHDSRESLRAAQKIANLGHFTFDLATGRWTSSDILDGILGIDAGYPRDRLHWHELIALPSREEMAEHLAACLRDRRPIDREYRIVRPCDGRERWVREIAEVHDAPGGGGALLVGTVQDITQHKEAEQRINNLAFFDQLTGVPNRTLLVDRLRQAVSSSGRTALFGALLFIDLDNFKTLNDTLGHDMGDLLLKLVAQRLQDCIRADDTVARLGGDEFILMVSGLSRVESEAGEAVEAIGRKVLAVLNEPYQLVDISYRCTPSIGVALFRGQDVTVDELLKQADLAMYKAKAAGRNAIRFFDSAMETAVLERAALESDLREALQGHQFQLYYQAQMAGDRLTGAEALLRWINPRRGMVPPTEFIPLAEETGLILPIGQWVLENACRQLAAWAVLPELSGLTLSVNVSARQFHQADFVQQVLSVIERTGAPPERLKLELTESLLVENVQAIVEKMCSLKARQVGFSLDDFGTGYSSLAYLKRLPLDQLKIDRSFVRDVLCDPNDAVIARSIVALGRSLGLGVIAEGVETEEQRAFLAAAGCHTYQGFLFSRPVPVDEFEHLTAWCADQTREGRPLSGESFISTSAE